MGDNEKSTRVMDAMLNVEKIIRLLAKVFVGQVFNLPSIKILESVRLKA